MKARTVISIWVLVALAIHRLLQKPTVCTLVYIAMSWLLDYDNDIVQTINFDGQREASDPALLHRFIPLSETSRGWPVEVTYHVVECGDRGAEPIVFFHGLGESWAVWKVCPCPCPVLLCCTIDMSTLVCRYPIAIAIAL
jgi:hypothetical protein